MPPSWQEMAGARTGTLAGQGQHAGWVQGGSEEVAERCGQAGSVWEVNNGDLSLVEK